MGKRQGIATGIHNAVRGQLEAARQQLNTSNTLLISLVRFVGTPTDEGTSVTIPSSAQKSGAWSLASTVHQNGDVTLTLTEVEK